MGNGVDNRVSRIAICGAGETEDKKVRCSWPNRKSRHAADHPMFWSACSCSHNCGRLHWWCRRPGKHIRLTEPTRTPSTSCTTTVGSRISPPARAAPLPAMIDDFSSSAPNSGLSQICLQTPPAGTSSEIVCHCSFSRQRLLRAQVLG